MHVPKPFSGKQRAFLVYLHHSLQSFSRNIVEKEISKGWFHKRMKMNTKWAKLPAVYEGSRWSNLSTAVPDPEHDGSNSIAWTWWPVYVLDKGIPFKNPIRKWRVTKHHACWKCELATYFFVESSLVRKTN